MRTRLILSGAAAILCAGALTSAQIAPQGGVQQQAPRPAAQQPQPTNERPMTTLAGCLYRESSTPGRSSNPAEKAGAGEEYVLADAVSAREQSRTLNPPIADAGPQPRPDQPGNAGVGQRDQPHPSAGASVGLAEGRTYKITKIEDERLKPLLGKRVEVTGTVKLDSHAGGAIAEDLPNFEGTAIREVTGQACPARPAGTSTAAPNSNR